jgi:oxygen-independent coproporphyrinogen-3 oxidase
MNAGLYIHIPFCRTKCPYCDFYSITSLSIIPKWLETLRKEILVYKGLFPIFDSLYLGGGTPTVLSQGQWSELMETLFTHFAFSPLTEVTVEANPDDVTEGLMGHLRGLGVNRISLGIQSFDELELHDLKRRHTSQRATKAIRCIRHLGFNNLGLDLMYGLPGQTQTQWLKTLKKAIDFEPEHLSCYQLTIEEETPFGKMRDKGDIHPLDEEAQRALFILTSSFLEQEGYLHYEISNFAKGKEFTSRHNMKYWKHLPYLGLGPSAHSFRGNRRWWNLKSVEGYCEALARGSVPLAGEETLSKEQQDLESLMLGLRTVEGIELDRLGDRSPSEKVLRDLKGMGLVRVEEGRVMPTREGFLVADSLPLLFSP